MTLWVGLPALVQLPRPRPVTVTRRGVVWCDDAGVTCRRWNWRQGRRTQPREDTTTALFILDALQPMTDEALDGAADALAARLAGRGRDVRTASRRIAAAPSIHEGN